MAAVSNSSPLILFSKAGRLDLLHDVFGEVFVPQAVFDEVVTRGVGRPGSHEIARVSWLKVQPVVGQALLANLASKAGRGEAEAIALAGELGSEIPLLIDDRIGRRLARELGLKVVGSAGVLVQAKAQGRIPLVSPILDELQRLGLHLSDAARREALIAANEVASAGAQG